MANSVQKEKALARRRMLALRRAVPEETRQKAAVHAAGNFFSLPEAVEAACVMVYLTYRSELPTEPLVEELRRRNVRVCAPRIQPDGTMEAADYPHGCKLSPGPYEILQPLETEALPLEALDVVVVPGVAFDESGYRLGFGKGYYDRFLAQPKVRAVKVGLAFDFQVLPEIPHTPDDAAVDVIATEKRVIRTRPQKR
ncbi:MAG: 5-formyltetrahydrofolate cyclo-ligase [Armatimonadota bacterium]